MLSRVALIFVLLVAFAASLSTCAQLIPLNREGPMRLVSDTHLAVMNAWMEARGESFEGIVAVCEVMRNRMKLNKWDLNKDKQTTLVEVVLAPYQFSGWNTKDPNRLKALVLDDESPE